MEQKRIAVVIVNYKTPELTLDAVSSLIGEIDIEKDQVIIVDNQSNDESQAVIENFINENDYGSWLSLILAPANGGFSYGNNIGLKQCDAQYYLLLNSDAYVRKGAISELLTSMVDQSVGVVGPKLEWESTEQQVSYFKNMTPLGEFVRTSKTSVISKVFRKLGIYEIPISCDDTETEIDWLSFACVFIRKEVINSIGYMDDKYFMYREDNDYCRRAKANGWKLAFNSAARVVHLNQGLSNKMSQRLPRFYYMSRSYYFKKYYGHIGLLAANIMWSSGWLISQTKKILFKKENNIHPMGVFDIWKGFVNDK